MALWRRAPVRDATTGEQIGTVRRRTMTFPLRLRAMYWIWDIDGRVVIRLHSRYGLPPYNVFGEDHELVGSFVPKSSVDKRGREREGTWRCAWDADTEGFVRVDGEDVARVASGRIVDTQTGRELAEVTPYEGRDGRNVSVLRLRVSDRVEGSLRLMALGWLGVAHHLVRGVSLEDL
jgi:hypothetical protein